MDFEIDPEGNEIRALERAACWAGRHVLEIGSGDGRLARRLAGLGASVTAIDPRPELVSSAVVVASESPSRSSRYVVGDGRRLPFSDESFDIGIFGWSL